MISYRRLRVCCTCVNRCREPSSAGLASFKMRRYGERGHFLEKLFIYIFRNINIPSSPTQNRDESSTAGNSSDQILKLTHCSSLIHNRRKEIRQNAVSDSSIHSSALDCSCSTSWSSIYPPVIITRLDHPLVHKKFVSGIPSFLCSSLPLFHPLTTQFPPSEF